MAGVALAIALTNVSGFPSLPGSVTGARDFASWAEIQGFEKVVVLTDETRPVRAKDLYRVVAAAVNAGVARIFVFFAGHGLARAFGEDLWLLSGALDNPNEAVDVAQSVRLARYSGIPHVAVFADTCRTVADSPSLLAVTGSSIFPTPNFSRNPCELDQFYGATPGQSAWERRSEDPNVPPYGIYSRCLLTALSGCDPRAVVDVDDGQAPQAVLSRGLRDYLNFAVPEASYRELGRYQWPDSVAGSFWKPNVLAWIWPTTSADDSVVPPTAVGTSDEGRSPAGDEAQESVISGIRRNIPRLSPMSDPEVDAAIAEEVEVCRQAGRAGGVFIVGAPVMNAVGSNSRWEGGRGGWGAGRRYVIESRPLEVFHEKDSWRILDWRNGNSPLYFEFGSADGRRLTAATTIFPGHTTVIRVSDRGVEQVIFVPTSRISLNIEEAITALARASVLGRMNLFDPDSEEWTPMLVEELNPGLAILAAYEWHRRGESDKIRGLIRRFRLGRKVTPFDLLFLRRHSRNFDNPLSSVFPLMTRGWPAFIDPALKSPVVNEYWQPSSPGISGNRDLLAQLQATPWTTFSSLTPAIREFLIR